MLLYLKKEHPGYYTSDWIVTTISTGVTQPLAIERVGKDEWTTTISKARHRRLQDAERFVVGVIQNADGVFDDYKLTPDESPLKEVIIKLNQRCNEDLTTKRIAELFAITAELREGLMMKPKEREKSWVRGSIIDLTKILVTLNYKAQKIVNPTIEMPSLESQIEEAINNLVI